MERVYTWKRAHELVSRVSLQRWRWKPFKVSKTVIFNFFCPLFTKAHFIRTLTSTYLLLSIGLPVSCYCWFSCKRLHFPPFNIPLPPNTPRVNLGFEPPASPIPPPPSPPPSFCSATFLSSIRARVLSIIMLNIR